MDAVTIGKKPFAAASFNFGFALVGLRSSVFEHIPAA
jgi:hypothetical protein